MKFKQGSYTVGVVSPALQVNSDTELWRGALAHADNMVIDPTGGASNRPGTIFNDSTTNGAVGRIIRFPYSENPTHGLVFGDGTLRRIIASNVEETGGAVQDFPSPDDGFEAASLTLAAAEDIPVAEDLRVWHPGAVFEQTLTITTAPTAAVVLNGFLGVSVEADLTLSLMVGTPTALGSASFTTVPSTLQLTLGQEHVIRFYASDQAEVWVDSWGNSRYVGLNNYVQVDDGPRLTVSFYQTDVSNTLVGSPYRDALYPRNTLYNEGSSLGVNFGPYRIYDRSATLLDMQPAVNDLLVDPPVQGYMYDSVSDTRIYEGGISYAYMPPIGSTVTYPDITSPYLLSELPELRYAQYGDAIFFTHANHPEYVLSRIDGRDDDWTLEQVEYNADIDAPGGLTALDDGGGAGTTLRYVVASVDSEGRESVCGAAASVDYASADTWPAGEKVTVAWTAVAGAERYRVYKNISGYYGFIGSTSDTELLDYNATPDTTDGPATGGSPLTGQGNYATAIGLFQQRKVYGGSVDNINRFWSTSTGSLSDMATRYPLQDTAAITADLVSQENNWIQHFVSAQNLLAFTNNGTWNVNSGSLREGLSYANIRFDLEDDEPCSSVRPLKAGRALLMVPEFKNRVRELASDYRAIGTQGRDLSTHAAHLFDGDEIVDWDFQRGENLLYCVMSSGSMNVLRYIPENGTLAWTTWTTDGSFENVCVIPGADRHIPFFIVRREDYAGGDIRCIEHLAPRAEALPERYNANPGATDHGYFLDSGARGVSISPTDSPGIDAYALLHLARRTVTVVGDATEYTGIEVNTSGNPGDISGEASYWNVGLPYTSRVETLAMDYSSRSGSALGDRKSVPQLTLCVRDTKNVDVGPPDQDLTAVDLDLADATELATGTFSDAIVPDWDSEGKLVLEQSHPFPMTIQTHVRDGQVSDL